MSETETTSSEPSASVEPSKHATAAMRVDAAHVISEPPGETAQVQTATPEPIADALAAAQLLQQVRTQATQLAGHLRRQQADLDQREAQLNARNAGVENQVRQARLWLAERQQELAERIDVVQRREQDVDSNSKTANDTQLELSARVEHLTSREEILAKQLAEFSAAERAWKDAYQTSRTEAELRTADLDHLHAELQQRQAELVAREAESAARQQELDERAAELSDESRRLADQITAGARAIQLQATVDRLEARQRNLDAAEVLLNKEQTEFQLQRQELVEEREALQDQARADRRRLAEEQRRAEADLDKKRQTLKRRSEELDARRTALKQLRAEVTQTQRDSLEMRLATEELWARLCGTMAPAALTQSMSQIRLKLADQNRLAHLEIAEQKAELQALAARLTEQHEKLAQQKQDLQAWVSRRTEEIEQQAALLVAREQELDRQENTFGQRDQQWQEERVGFQHEIRGLLRQLRRAESVAA